MWQNSDCNWLSGDYEKKIWTLCVTLEVGKVFDITVYVAPERRAKFVEIVKSYIDHENSDNTTIEFNEDYTKMRKIENNF